MPKNKQPMVRYMELDRCFRDTRKIYHMEDLVEAVNKVLEDYNGTSVSERQIREDIRFMQREAGWAIELRDWMDGHRKIYRYVDTDFTIQEKLLSQREAQLLGDAVQVLSRFEGLPQLDWMNELLARLRTYFHLGNTEAGMVSFEQNPRLRGMEWFTTLFEAIVSRRVVIVKYHRFGHPSRERIVHPYQLKQNRNRWYLVGKEERQMPRHEYVMLPLDRIDGVEVTTEEVKWKREDLGIDRYLDDVVGVSLNPESKVERVVLKVGYPDAEYLETKPLHFSQEVIERVAQTETEAGSVTFEMNVVVNFELETQILGYLHNGEVVEPSSLREKLVKRAEAILAYNKKE